MSGRVSISAKHAAVLLSIIDRAKKQVVVSDLPAVMALKEALKPKLSKPMRRARVEGIRADRAAKRAATSAVYEAVSKRAGLVCECGCGRWFRGVGGAKQMDHFEGRARSESAETCWMLRADCHAEKTRNHPSARAWLLKFIAHCDRFGGYGDVAARAEARLDALRLSAESAAAGKAAQR